MSDSDGAPETPHPLPTRRAVVMAGGAVPPAGLASLLAPNRCTVIAADSGWDAARAIGLVPEVVIGDLDSISTEGLAEARSLGATIIVHPPDKDSTDTELAVEHAVSTGADHVTVVLGGDRIDHLLGALHVLADPTRTSIHLDGFVGGDRVTRVVAGRDTTIITAPGRTVSLVPVGGDAAVHSTAGLRWQLCDEVLAAHSSRGVSNVATHDRVVISLRSGTLLVIEPGYFGAGADRGGSGPW